MRITTIKRNRKIVPEVGNVFKLTSYEQVYMRINDLQGELLCPCNNKNVIYCINLETAEISCQSRGVNDITILDGEFVTEL